jgi:predicted RNA polymerase sigma factor
MAHAETAARGSYGRLLSMLAVRTGDLAGAEDALAEAFAAAVESWPRDGTPQNPDGWLWTAARRRLADAVRRRKTSEEKEALSLTPRFHSLLRGGDSTDLPRGFARDSLATVSIDAVSRPRR